ncbi:cardiolipin synthase [Thermoactinomyces mirandus]|uniref:Cardiolipin synthase n=1 Tax=Thermoactinomyces mirandus TaxID=2756294 RepID=A0A7W1XRE2_9BACL|nr:cardiolipin synthase [Thermoactinomyces mirandus]MBA4601786.1 cardiolipin synthase [Thermoactinomyces mirandus]
MDVFLLSLLTMVNILLAIVIIFLERRNVAATWAWILILLFLPVVGFILYIIFGQNLSKRKIFRFSAEHTNEYAVKITQQTRALEEHRFRFRDPAIIPYQSIIYMNLVSGNGLFTQDNEVDIFTDGHAKFEALIEDINHAKDHIHLLYFIIKNDRIGNRILHALAQKAKEGVKVRVLYDDMGSSRLPSRFFKPLIEAGGEVAVFFPSKFIPYLNFRVNYRNHRKLVVIDGKIGYIGGFNIGDEYLGLNPKLGYWRDTHLRLQGSSVDALQTRFFLDWNNASLKPLNFERRYFPIKVPKGKSALQIVSSGPDSEWEQIKNGMIKMIYSARERIDIQTPYFVPDDSLMHALKIAALSGVEIRIMIPNKPDHMFVYWATYAYIGELLKVGVRCFIYEHGFIHAKMMVVDGKIASVGTANFDVRSFKLNFEVNAFIFDVVLARRLQTIFEKDLRDSKEMTNEMYNQRSYWIRFKESISRLLSPIL